MRLEQKPPGIQGEEACCAALGQDSGVAPSQSPVTFPQCPTRSNSRAPAPWQPPNERGADSDVSEADGPPRPGQLSSWLGRTIAPLRASSVEASGMARGSGRFGGVSLLCQSWLSVARMGSAWRSTHGVCEVVCLPCLVATLRGSVATFCISIPLCSGGSISRLGCRRREPVSLCRAWFMFFE